MANPLLDLEKYGQSFWLDYISQELLSSGELHDLIANDHLKGLTSNPSIFEKSIAKTNNYDAAIEILWSKDLKNPKKVYENLAIKDIQQACDFLLPTYEENKGIDGFASLEVSPHLANDAQATIEEGRRLWHQVDRRNLMIKVPGTTAGASAIRMLIAEGINVNVTLLFSVEAYQTAAEAYLLGLKDRAEKGLPIDSVQSVASFFISRIDSKIDAQLEHIIQNNPSPGQVKLAQSLLGCIAIANAKAAYLAFEDIYQDDLAKTLVRKGAHPQRLLWASTSVKNPRYSDVMYVDSLIGYNTVNTMPLETIAAFRHHGRATHSLIVDMRKAQNTVASLAELGINFSAICEELLEEGLQLFVKAFDQLLDVVEKKMAKMSLA